MEAKTSSSCCPPTEIFKGSLPLNMEVPAMNWLSQLAICKHGHFDYLWFQICYKHDPLHLSQNQFLLCSGTYFLQLTASYLLCHCFLLFNQFPIHHHSPWLPNILLPLMRNFVKIFLEIPGYGISWLVHVYMFLNSLKNFKRPLRLVSIQPLNLCSFEVPPVHFFLCPSVYLSLSSAFNIWFSRESLQFCHTPGKRWVKGPGKELGSKSCGIPLLQYFQKYLPAMLFFFFFATLLYSILAILLQQVHSFRFKALFAGKNIEQYKNWCILVR